MSGGSFSYTCWRVQEEYEGNMRDFELNEMIKDLVDVLHDLEWWVFGDYGEDSYRKTVRKFKDKWFNTPSEERVERIINQKCAELKKELEKCFLSRGDQ